MANRSGGEAAILSTTIIGPRPLGREIKGWQQENGANEQILKNSWMGLLKFEGVFEYVDVPEEKKSFHQCTGIDFLRLPARNNLRGTKSKQIEKVVQTTIQKKIEIRKTLEFVPEIMSATSSGLTLRKKRGKKPIDRKEEKIEEDSKNIDSPKTDVFRQTNEEDAKEMDIPNKEEAILESRELAIPIMKELSLEEEIPKMTLILNLAPLGIQQSFIKDPTTGASRQHVQVGIYHTSKARG
ncbi:hypothetical protein CRG98_020017 [Punica granatum]|uniref:Uncharacterized protein n=1 Tax=Punica granatum TaxID=22663 RepID=A0A2I0JTI1_PUNGR|nr:hypothetical protein CRG98_020017 [Punica granatum]